LWGLVIFFRVGGCFWIVAGGGSLFVWWWGGVHAPVLCRSVPGTNKKKKGAKPSPTASRPGRKVPPPGTSKDP